MSSGYLSFLRRLFLEKQAEGFIVDPSLNMADPLPDQFALSAGVEGTPMAVMKNGLLPPPAYLKRQRAQACIRIKDLVMPVDPLSSRSDGSVVTAQLHAYNHAPFFTMQGFWQFLDSGNSSPASARELIKNEMRNMYSLALRLGIPRDQIVITYYGDGVFPDHPVLGRVDLGRIWGELAAELGIPADRIRNIGVGNLWTEGGDTARRLGPQTELIYVPAGDTLFENNPRGIEFANTIINGFETDLKAKPKSELVRADIVPAPVVGIEQVFGVERLSLMLQTQNPLPQAPESIAGIVEFKPLQDAILAAVSDDVRAAADPLVLRTAADLLGHYVRTAAFLAVDVRDPAALENRKRTHWKDINRHLYTQLWLLGIAPSAHLPQWFALIMEAYRDVYPERYARVREMGAERVAQSVLAEKEAFDKHLVFAVTSMLNPQTGDLCSIEWVQRNGHPVLPVLFARLRELLPDIRALDSLNTVSLARRFGIRDRALFAQFHSGLVRLLAGHASVFTADPLRALEFEIRKMVPGGNTAQLNRLMGLLFSRLVLAAAKNEADDEMLRIASDALPWVFPAFGPQINDRELFERFIRTYAAVSLLEKKIAWKTVDRVCRILLECTRTAFAEFRADPVLSVAA